MSCEALKMLTNVIIRRLCKAYLYSKLKKENYEDFKAIKTGFWKPFNDGF